jgi:hypothetical protein
MPLEWASTCELPRVVCSFVTNWIFRSVKRIIFFSLKKRVTTLDGEVMVKTIEPYEALQIGGRAGRYGMSDGIGQVTTLHAKDLRLLKALMQTPLKTIEAIFSFNYVPMTD